MDDFNSSYFDSQLLRLERLITSPNRSRTDIRRQLRFLAHVMLRASRGRDPSIRELVHRLIRRAESAKTLPELREIVRDVRQYQVALASVARAQDLEQRLHDLEGQLRAVPETAVTDSETPTTDVVTLASLKNKRVLFSIMPFAKEFNDVWMGGIKRAASGTGLTAVRIDMITQSSEI